jgi:hypothetical protein
MASALRESKAGHHARVLSAFDLMSAASANFREPGHQFQQTFEVGVIGFAPKRSHRPPPRRRRLSARAPSSDRDPAPPVRF